MAMEGSAQNNIITKILLAIKAWLGQFFDNPVIGREMKVRVRFGKSFWFPAIFLGFIVLVTGIAYLSVVGSGLNSNIYQMQQNLQGVYMAIIMTIITLLIMTIPALTASSISWERENKTLDLLLTAPLKSRDLLTGKLIASVSYILLMLVLTLPALGVCVMLGGASIPEVISSYGMVLANSIFIAAIGITCSAFSAKSGTAVFSSYGVTILVLILSGIPSMINYASTMAMTSSSGLRFNYSPLATLNPFGAPFTASTVTPLFGLNIPTWIIAIFFSALITRMMLTAASNRVGLFDKNTLPSLRRQMLFFGIVLSLFQFAAVAEIFKLAGIGTGMSVKDQETSILLLLAIGTYIIITATTWIGTFGSIENKPAVDDGIFKIKKMFQPSIAGALPYLLTLFVGMVIPALAPIFIYIKKMPSLEFYGYIGYFGLLIVLFSFISKLISYLCKTLMLSRIVALFFIQLFIFLPLLISLNINSIYNMMTNNDMEIVWIFGIMNPLFKRPIDNAFDYLIIYSFSLLALIIIIGTLLYYSGKKRVATQAENK